MCWFIHHRLHYFDGFMCAYYGFSYITDEFVQICLNGLHACCVISHILIFVAPVGPRRFNRGGRPGWNRGRGVLGRVPGLPLSKQSTT